MKIKLVGTGRMGTLLYSMYTDAIVEWVDAASELDDALSCDAIVDFSHPDNLPDLLDAALKASIPLILATTGYTQLQKKMIAAAAQRIAICPEANFSSGIMQMKRMLRLVAKDYEEAIVTEVHHVHKKDRPSGTALQLQEVLLQENPDMKVRIRSVRMKEICGIHSVQLQSGDERIVLTHVAETRIPFAAGAYHAAEKIIGKAPGIYSFGDLSNDER